MKNRSELSKREIGITLIVAFGFAIGLFFLAPLGITRLFRHQLGTGIVFWLVEGLVRVTIFVVYLLIVTRFRDLRRVFEYHGAEHMIDPRARARRRAHGRQRRQVRDAAPALRHVVPAHRDGGLDPRLRRRALAGAGIC